MGARGPARIPTEIKILRGNPGRQKLDIREPKPIPKAPPCPKWLDRRARKEWFKLAPALERLRLLTEVDGNTLAAYCQSFSNWRTCMDIVAEQGLTYETRHYETLRRRRLRNQQTDFRG